MNPDDINKPFIKKFIDGGLFYIYDVNTNRIIEVEENVFNIIDQSVDRCSPRNETLITPTLRKSLEEIERARKDHGIFSNFRPKKVTMGIENADGVREVHKNGLKQIVLELTRNCTLNCAYCPTSGKYSKGKGFKVHMSKETCKKSVDFFCERSFNTNEPYISFYGGEPILRIDLIKEIVSYIHTKYGTRKFKFNLTTNGTIFNKEILDFFIENDFDIMVSLDGPEKINDRYRRFKNGKGSFNRIMKNLEFLNTYNKDYFSSKVTISSVISPPFDIIDEITDFFLSNKTLNAIKSNITSNLVYTRDTCFLEDYGLVESFNEFSKTDKKLIENIKKAILHHNLNNLTIEKTNVYKILYNLTRRQKKLIYEYIVPFGACHIGLKRLFVNTAGEFFICERSGYDYKIGCIEKGFDYERIAYYYRKLDEVLDDCRHCWAINHCERCWVLLGKLEEFTGEIREAFCSSNKKIIEEAFKLYTQLLREDPDCLKVFKDVVVA